MRLPHLSLTSREIGWIALLGCSAASCGDKAPAPSPQAPGSESPAAALVAPSEGTWLTEVTDASGLTFRHVAGPTEQRCTTQMLGSGIAFLDYDTDGDQDLYLMHAGSDPTRGVDREGAENALYRNEGNGQLTEQPGALGLVGKSYGIAAAVGDVDNDGYPDVFLTNFGPNQLFANRKGERFEDVSRDSGDLPGRFSASAAFLDYDRDGHLDLYVIQYVYFKPSQRCFDQADRLDFCGPTTFDPESDILLHNLGDGTFEDVSEAAGLNSAAAAGLGVVVRDFNDDGWPDVFVANDTYENHLWINQQDGTFVDDAVVLGVAFNMHGQHEAGMGVLSEDFDNDGLYDLFMTHLTRETNTFYRNIGPGMGFADATGQSGLGTPSKTYTGFGTAPLDLELDGDLDLVVVNGRVTRGEVEPPFDMPDPWCFYAERNLVFVNAGGAQFEPRSEPDFGRLREVSRAVAVADWDNDGDTDVAVGNIDSRARLYRNDSPRRGKWLRVVVRDPRLKRYAIGAKTKLTCGERSWIRTVSRAYSYLTSNDPRLLFGVPDEAAGGKASLEVEWPDGLVETFDVPGLDREITVLRGEGKAR